MDAASSIRILPYFPRWLFSNQPPPDYIWFANRWIDFGIISVLFPSTPSPTSLSTIWNNKKDETIDWKKKTYEINRANFFSLLRAISFEKLTFTRVTYILFYLRKSPNTNGSRDDLRANSFFKGNHLSAAHSSGSVDNVNALTKPNTIEYATPLFSLHDEWLRYFEFGHTEECRVRHYSSTNGRRRARESKCRQFETILTKTDCLVGAYAPYVRKGIQRKRWRR